MLQKNYSHVICLNGHLRCQKTDIKALYRKRDMTIDRPNKVCATDITNIPMCQGFVYLVAVLDIFNTDQGSSPA